MAETAAVKRAEEPMRPIKFGSLFDQIQDTFNALSRRAYEIFEGNGRAFGRDLEDWFQAESELLHPVHVNIEESDDSLSPLRQKCPDSAKRNSKSVLTRDA